MTQVLDLCSGVHLGIVHPKVLKLVCKQAIIMYSHLSYGITL